MDAFTNPSREEDLQIEESASILKCGLSGLYETTGVGANWPINRVGKGERGMFTEFLIQISPQKQALAMNLNHYR